MIVIGSPEPARLAREGSDGSAATTPTLQLRQGREPIGPARMLLAGGLVAFLVACAGHPTALGAPIQQPATHSESAPRPAVRGAAAAPAQYRGPLAAPV